MNKTKKMVDRWEVSVAKINDGYRTKYEVTGKIVGLEVTCTKTFFSELEAKQQFEEWLQC